MPSPSGPLPNEWHGFLLLRHVQLHTSYPILLCKWQQRSTAQSSPTVLTDFLCTALKCFVSISSNKYHKMKPLQLLAMHFISYVCFWDLHFQHTHSMLLHNLRCLFSIKRMNTYCEKFQSPAHNKKIIPGLFSSKTKNPNTNLYLILVWEGRSLLEYCLDSWLKSPSPFPLPPLAGSNVGLAAVVILTTTESRIKNSCYYNLQQKTFTKSYAVPETVAAMRSPTT